MSTEQNNQKNQEQQENKEQQECTCNSLPSYSEQIKKQITKATADKVKQNASEIIDNNIKQLTDSIQELLKIINGYEDTSDPEFDPKKIIEDIQTMIQNAIDPLIKMIEELKLPEIPGIQQIKMLLTAISEKSNSTDADSNDKDSSDEDSPEEKSKKLPEIPPEIVELLKDLLNAITTLAITLPMTIVNILLNVVDLILGVGIPGGTIGDIASTSDPTGFIASVDTLVTLAPQITPAITNIPGQINTAIKAKIKQQIDAVNNSQIPEPPTSINIKPPTVCPTHSKEKNEEKDKENSK